MMFTRLVRLKVKVMLNLLCLFVVVALSDF